jgi:hypothetical protein
MRAIYLPDSDEFLTVEDALLLITSLTNPVRVTTQNIPTFSHEQNERALRDAHESGTVTLQDEESMRVGSPSKNLDSTRQRVTAEIKSSHLAAISATLWISLADVQRFAKLRFVRVHALLDELSQDGYTIYDVENELGYTIRGAAKALAKKYPVSERAMGDRIFDAAEQGMLHVRDPQTGMLYNPKDRSNHYERISVSELNQWLEESGVPYRLGDDSADPATATAATGPRNIDRQQVMQIFSVRPKADQNHKFWDDKLGRPPAWLRGARTFAGKPGLSARWNPLLVAHALVDKKYMTLNQLDSAVHEHLPALLVQWKEETHDLR